MNQGIGPDLERGIRRWDLVALGINLVVGAGIFGLPSQAFALSGPASLLAFGVCSVAISLIALCFAEVSSRYSRTGGVYLYARDAYGGFTGFQVGWLRWVSGVSAWAANSHLMVSYLAWFGPETYWEKWRVAIVVASALTFTVVNLLGVRDVTMLSNVLTVAKLLPLLTFVAVGLIHVSWGNLAMTPLPGYDGFSTTALLLLYAFVGFESIPVPAGEVREPRRQVPFALLVTIGSVTVLYVLIQLVCIGTLPHLGNSARPLADAAGRFIGPAGGLMISGAAIVSIAGNLNGTLLSNSRILFAMAEQRQVSPKLAVTHLRFHTPHRAILVTAFFIILVALSGTFLQLLTVSVITRVAMYAITCSALPVLRRKYPRHPPAFRLPGAVLFVPAAVVVCIWLLSNSTELELKAAVAAVTAGIPIYLYYRLSPPAAG